jgi:hypothetical protein
MLQTWNALVSLALLSVGWSIPVFFPLLTYFYIKKLNVNVTMIMGIQNWISAARGVCQFSEVLRNY